MSSSVMRISTAELCEREGVSRALLVELVEYEVAHPLAGESSDDWIFDTGAAGWLTRAIRLRRDLDLDCAAVAMLIDLLRQRERLQRENRCLRQQLERFVSPEHD
jgi:chaperone modulatory protein CbpM